jgi:hypothetical protein
MERPSLTSTSEMPNVAMIGGVGLPCKARLGVEAARRSNKGGMWTLILVNTGDDIKKIIHAYSPMPSTSRKPAEALNQDRTAVDHNGLPSTESFLHQEQIGLRDFRSFAHSTDWETVAHAFV